MASLGKLNHQFTRRFNRLAVDFPSKTSLKWTQHTNWEVTSMEEKQIGLFIRDRRLALGLTQQQLADKLGVTDKAVSKWERCVSCPDITLLRDLAGALEVSVSELLAGELDAAPSAVLPEVEDVVLDTVRYAETARQKNGGWRFWLFVALSANCLLAALVLLILYGALGSPALLLASKCVGFGWALCCPLLRSQRHPVRDFLLLLSFAIVPFLLQFRDSYPAHIYGIVFLSVACLWAVYFLFRRLRVWAAAGGSILLGGLLGYAINAILGLPANPVNIVTSLLTAGACFLIDFTLRRRRAE